MSPFILPPDFTSLSRLEQIQVYLDAGFLVHPCYGPRERVTKPGKQPRWKVPQRLSTPLQERLEAFRTNPSDNVGVVPRAPHVILDVDAKENRDALTAFEQLHPKLYGDTLRVGSHNGLHIHLFCPDVPPNQRKITIENYLPGLSVEILSGTDSTSSFLQVFTSSELAIRLGVLLKNLSSGGDCW
jgi:hypothetical protein